MVETLTPHGSSSWRSVLVKRFRAAFEAPYDTKQGKGCSPAENRAILITIYSNTVMSFMGHIPEV